MKAVRLKIALLLMVALLAFVVLPDLWDSKAELSDASASSPDYDVVTGFWASEGQSSASRDTLLSRFSMNSGGNIYTQSTNYRVGLSLAQFVAGPLLPCDCIPGDANGDGREDIDDVVYKINYIFAGGPAPTPYVLCSGDADCSCAIDIDDVVYEILYIFAGGPAPCSCEEWVDNCGLPLR